MSPEEKARIIIDKKLTDAGWILQDMSEFNPHASFGVAVREFKTNDGGEVDYALFIDAVPVGLVEAKKEDSGVTLSTEAHEQNMKYVKVGLKGNYDKKDLRFIYEATSVITEFTDLYDPNPLLRKIFSFHQPQYLQQLIKDYEYNGNQTLRARLKNFPELPSNAKFRKCQIEAITNLEKSFGENKQRALIQMATGAGKTYTAITNTYRLLKFAKAKRILFLVDTKNLGEQAENEYKNYQPYDNTAKLSELYNIQRIQTSNISQDTVICISTIQRLYSMLKGEINTFVDDADDELGGSNIGSARDIVYNKDYPPEFFDFIIIDECHRSIYNLWRQVIEYFDAFLIGLTATPNCHTFSFFYENVVSEYTHEQAVDDAVNVSALGTFLIETEKTKQGGLVPNIKQMVEVRDKRTRDQRWKETDEDVQYSGIELDNSVVNESQIRLVLKTFKENWQKWNYYKDRKELPKTLIFAKNDSHAADIVQIAKEVFAEGNDFCKKITYTSEEDEKSLLYAFRYEYNPRIAVTVAKIATGTDVKAIEILIFMRDIRSENYYEQMLGRARRTLNKDELVKSSPSANTPKLGYVIVDAVGVTKSKKSKGKCGTDFKPTTTFKQLLDSIITGDISEETFTTLGTRITHIAQTLTDKEQDEFKNLSNDVTIRQLAIDLKAVHDIDKIMSEIKETYPEYETLSPLEQEKIKKEIIKKRCKKAAKPLFEPKVRKYLMTIRNSNDQTIDPSMDSLLHSGLDEDVNTNKENIRKSFKEFIDQNRDEIDALKIIYNQNYANRKITESMIHDLYDKMQRYKNSLQQSLVFSAYEENTKKKAMFVELVDIIQIIRYEWKQIKELIPFEDSVRARYQKWIMKKNENKQGKRGNDTVPFTEEQLLWLKMIRDFIAKNASISAEDMEIGVLKKNGGMAKYYSLFGENWEKIINELNQALAA